MKETTIMMQITQYMESHQKQKKIMAALCILSLLTVFGVYDALMVPAISMEKGNPALGVETPVTLFGETSTLNVGAAALSDAEESYFYLLTQEVNAGLADQEIMEDALEQEFQVSTWSEDALTVHREVLDESEGVVGYYFNLPQNTSQVFDLNFVSRQILAEQEQPSGDIVDVPTIGAGESVPDEVAPDEIVDEPIDEPTEGAGTETPGTTGSGETPSVDGETNSSSDLADPNGTPQDTPVDSTQGDGAAEEPESTDSTEQTEDTTADENTETESDTDSSDESSDTNENESSGGGEMTSTESTSLNYMGAGLEAGIVEGETEGEESAIEGENEMEEPSLINPDQALVSIYVTNADNLEDARNIALDLMHAEDADLTLTWLDAEQYELLDEEAKEPIVLELPEREAALPEVVMPEGATSWATTEKEGFEGDPYGIMTLDLADENEIMAIADGAIDPVDFGPYITTATVSKLVGGQWVADTKFSDGDQVQVYIKYDLPSDKVNQTNKSICYQLPNGINPLKQETGSVYDGGRIVGSYVITTDGLITITFNDEFADGDPFIGTIQFKGTVSEAEAGEGGRIEFAGTGGFITIEEQKEQNDITISKTGTLNEDKTKINYVLTVSTVSGTEESVTVGDRLEGYGIEGSYDTGSLVVNRITEGGYPYVVPPESYTVQYGTNSNGNPDFTITNLPALSAGESYEIKYNVDLDAKITSDNGFASMNNVAHAQSGKEDKWANDTVEVSKTMIQKTGGYDNVTGRINWTIVVNQDKKDIGGYVLSDTLPEGLTFADAIIIKGSDGQQVGKIQSTNGNSFTYTFPPESSDTYTITYQTDASNLANGTTVTNKASLMDDKGNNFTSSSNVGVTQREWALHKQFSNEESREDGTMQYTWQSTITLPVGEIGEFTYTDTIQDADGKSDSHYAIASDLEIALRNSLKLQLASQNTVGYDNDTVEFIIKYFDKKGAPVLADDMETYVKSFTITVTPKGAEVFQGINLQFQYPTIADISDVEQGQTVSFINKGEVDKIKVEAQHDYTKPPRLDKQSGILTGLHWSYSSKVDFDTQGGIIQYQILLQPEKGENTDITITDTLPAGATLVSDSVNAAYYKDEWWSWTDNYDGYDFNTDQYRPKVGQEIQSDGTTKLKITILGGYNSGGGKGFPIAIRYQVSVEADPYWDDLTHETNHYTNKVEWGDETDEQTTEVTRKVDKVQKQGVQLPMLDAEGNPIYGTDGTASMSNVVEYSVLINPAGADLHPTSEELVLEDTLTINNANNAYLDLLNLKLYQYDSTREDNRGEVIDVSRYRVQYDAQAHKMTVTLPDQLACVLVYQYTVDRGGYEESFLRNSVSLMGFYDNSTDINLIKASSSATAEKLKFTIYKVDSANYGKLLSGAEFTLHRYQDEQAFPAGVYETNEDGMLVLNGKSDNDTTESSRVLETNTLYRLNETKAPAGYSASNATYYFVLLELGYTADQVWDTLQGNGVDRADVHFYNMSDGVLYVPNDYTRVSVNKVWIDQNNKEIAPTQSSIEVQLYRQTTKPDVCEVTVIVRNVDPEESWMPRYSETVQIPRGQGAIIRLTGHSVTFTNDEGYVVNQINGDEATIELDKVTEDVTITVKSSDIWKSQYKPEVTTAPDEDGNVVLPDYVTVEKTLIETIALNADNGWLYYWDGLARTDENGNPYYYTVEEVVPAGCTVQYTNNGGIFTGEILITNKVSTYVLPETGGVGTQPFYLAGLLLMASAALLLWKNQRYGRGNV